MAIGFCLVAGSLWVWILALSYFLLCYLPVILHEEKKLREMFPDRYASYAASVPALFPTLRAYPHSTTRFSWKQVIKNKEYNALLGILLAYLLLHFR